MTINLDIVLGGKTYGCTAERDGPFWRVTGRDRPDITVSAKDLPTARKLMELRLRNLESKSHG